jgi:hypothetical protein
MYVTLQSSTCFEHQHAHLQEDKLYYHSTWYRHSLYSTVQYAGREQTAEQSILRFIHSFSILSDDRSKASSKTIPPHSAI